MSELRFNNVQSTKTSFFNSRIRVAVFAAALLATANSSVFAIPEEAPPQLEIQNAESTVAGIINTNNAFIRCGPADSYYPTLKLNKGTKITVVGMKGSWLKIVPPDGSFCYIAKAFVDRNGDGTVGKVNHDASPVRAGSTENTLKVVPLCQLSVGMDVKILGEQDEYYKITPPDGKAFVYIDRQFVDRDPDAKIVEPVAPVKPNPEATGPVVGKIEMPKLDAATIPGSAEAIAKTETPGQKPETGTTGTKPEMPQFGAGITPNIPGATGISSNTGTSIKTTQPTDANLGGTGKSITDDPAMVEALYDKAESEYAAITSKPLDEQVVTPLQKEYEFLIATAKLPSSMNRIAETRVATLKLRASAVEKLVEAKAAQLELQKKQMSLKSEQKELQDQVTANGVTVYTAVGELRASSLQVGGKTLYRLTDPANGRTVCYIRTSDPQHAVMLGKFVGVKGEISTEAQLSLKVVATPTELSVVDPAKIHRGVTASVLPPSMIMPDDASTASHVIEGK